MRNWIVRKDLQGVSVGMAHCFLDGSTIARIPGTLTLEEYAALHRVAVPGVVQAILRELDTHALFQRTRGRPH